MMDKRTKFNFVILALFLLLCICVVYYLPRAKYTGKAITAEILDALPQNGQRWQGKDVDIKDITDNLQSDVYGFISRIFARQYTNNRNPELNVFFVVLDAGNFHYPKVCFQGIGFVSEELAPRELDLQPGKLQTHLLLHRKGQEKILSVYWICIDQQIVPTWVQQKLKQLYYSLFNKQRVGLMLRVDLPVVKGVENTVAIAEDFLSDIREATPEAYQPYIFGLEVSP